MAFIKKKASKKRRATRKSSKAKGRPSIGASSKGKARAMSPARRKGADVSASLAMRIAEIASDKKAEDIVVLDLRPLAGFTDFFVIMSGSSDRQVEAVAGAIREEIKKGGRLPISEEGMRSGRWALIDYGDVVTHIFYRTEREHYQLEKLWYDAPRVKIKDLR